jgi:6-phosphofructokinase
MGSYAVELLRKGIGGQAVCANGIEIFHLPIEEALIQNKPTTDLYQFLEKLN